MSVKSFGRRQASPVLGWWSVREAEERLVRSDGASVRFLGFVNPDEERGEGSSHDRHWMRFEAAVSNRSIELFVQQRDVFNPSGSRPLIWRLDYVFSLQQLGIVAWEHEEWIEIDRLICDALVCWPEREATGLRPALIAVNGGWHKGQWRKECYRTFSMAYLDALGRNAVLRSPVFSEWPIRRWCFLPPARQVTVEEEMAAHERFSAAKPEEVEDLVFGLLRHRPHLLSDDRIFVPLSRIGGQTNWLYMDDEIITDRISAFDTVLDIESNWMFKISNEVLVGTIDRRSGTAFNFDFRQESIKGNLKSEFGNFPPAVLDRFRDLYNNAVWQWKEARFYLCDRSSIKNPAKEICIQPPKRLRADNMVSAAGTAVRVNLVTAEELHDGRSYYQDMVSYFNDDPALLNRPIWEQFEYQADASSLTDRTTGQKIELREIVSGSGKVTDDCRGVFRYCDSDGEYLLMVTRESRKTNHQAGQWVLDYEASRSKNQQSGRQSIPDIRWHEIAGFSRDALLAWPETEIFGPAPSTLLEIGGCFQGRWEPQLRRRQRYAHLRTVQSDLSVGRYRVEASALQPWNVIEPDVDIESTSSRVQAVLRKLSAQSADTASINQTRPPGWLRVDGRAIFYLQDWQTLRAPPDGDPYQAPVFEYLDEDITLRLFPRKFNEYEMASLALIEVNPASVFYGEVEFLPAVPPAWHSEPRWRPTREIWYRIVTAMEAQVERISGQLQVNGLYTSHGYNSYAARTVWLERS